MGGGITRAAAELQVALRRRRHRGRGQRRPAHAHGRQAVRGVWPSIDPKTHPGLRTPILVVAFAAAIAGAGGSAAPVAARRQGGRPSARSGARRRQLDGSVRVPTIEVAGTWTTSSSRNQAYRARVSPADKHRLYLVEGVWHMSGDDDGTQSFISPPHGPRPDVANAMREGPSIPTVQDASTVWCAGETGGAAAQPDSQRRPAAGAATR
jgi:hypothetical protein